MSIPVQPLGAGTGVRPLERAASVEEQKRTAERGGERISTPRRDPGPLPGLPQTIQAGERTAEFSYDQDLDRIVVKIYSSSSEPREIVRQIPPEEYREFVSKFQEMLGVIFDEQA